MDPIEENLKLWRDRILSNVKRKELSPGEISSFFQNPELQTAFFRIMDHDDNGNLSQEEWTGSYLKLLGNEEAQYLINWFIEQFVAVTERHESEYLTLEHFAEIASDNEFGYRFSALISPKCRRVSALQLITSLEIIASCSTDSKWLKWLKYQFTAAMDKEDRLDKNELHVTLDDFVNNFYFKEPFLAHRLFNYLDKDKSGYLSLHEFINGLEVVVNGTQEQKFEFLFKVFDMDGDGRLNFQDMRMMLKCCLENLPSLDKNETIEELSVALFQDIDKDSSGDISLDELKDAFRRHTGIYNSLTVSTSIWIKPKFITKNRKMRYFYRLKETITNNRASFTFWSVYTLISVACALTAYFSYSDQNPWVIMARMCGNNLNFNCSLILFLVCRKHATWMRSKGANSIVPIDDFIEIHKKIGIVILTQSVIHTVAHLVNLFIVCNLNNYNYWSLLFTAQLNLGFPTGVLLIILLVVILVFAMPIVRKSGHFQVFFCFHLLTLPWLLITLLHGKNFWKWLLFPAVCYTIEAVLRFRKTRSDKFGDTFISEMIVLPSKVIHLVIRKPPKFHYRPGDYLFINIPMIAKYEWHPFSISSAPERSDYIWLHIRCAGNWTRKLYNFASTYALDKNKPAVSSDPHACQRVSQRKKSHMVQISLGYDAKNGSAGQVNIDLADQAAEKPTTTPKKQTKTVVRFKNSPNVLESKEEYQNDTVIAFEKQTTTTTAKDDTIDINLEAMYGSSNNSKVEGGSVLIDAETGLEMTPSNQMMVNRSLSESAKAKEAETLKSMANNSLDRIRKESLTKELEAQNSCEFHDTGDHDDELGYLKMYKRSNRICLGNMGLDECWRLKISIDGPYGTSSQAIFDSEHAVLIAAGIGITPFASVLQSMMNRFSRMNAKCHKCETPISQNILRSADEEISIKKVDFIWVTRDQRSLEWFISLLSRMEIEQRKHNQNFLETHLYVTSAKRQSDMKTINLHLTLDAIFSQEESSLIDGLRQRSHSGRPNWDIVFQNLIRKQRGKINVFYCGPPNLGEILEDKCNEYKLAFTKEFF